MNKTIAAATVAASLAAGGLAGMALGTPSLASARAATDEAATDAAGPDEAVSWVDEALSGLVSDGTITQQQADDVARALDEARPARGVHGRRGHHLAVAAEALGMGEDELRTALDGGRTIAQVAADEGIDVQTVVDALVADARARIDQAVTDGALTQDEADERIARIEERATAMVDGVLPPRDGHRGPGDPFGHGGPSGHGAGEEDAPA